MKRNFFLVLFVLAGLISQAQESYKFILIPTNVPGIGSGIDPYGVSSSMQKILAQKSIVCAFESSERPSDYCDGLTAVITKESSILKVKVSIELRDCMNWVVWENEGVGMSKEFRQGYAEAIEDAFKDLKDLPVKKQMSNQQSAAISAPIVAEKAMPVEAPVVDEGEADGNQTKIVYYNEKFLIEYATKADGSNALIILNGKSLGYEKMQTIANLIPSDLPGIYTVKWIQPNGDEWSGVASETGSELKISISSGDTREVITLQKQ
ncbi:hypothetical protein [Mangrovibacterium sp.]|uniref:hypothetical protein n=1 Tax=Mangrovibacterium sp. TaxID=1961364 RepID=UPI003564786B